MVYFWYSIAVIVAGGVANTCWRVSQIGTESPAMLGWLGFFLSAGVASLIFNFSGLIALAICTRFLNSARWSGGILGLFPGLLSGFITGWLINQTSSISLLILVVLQSLICVVAFTWLNQWRSN